MNLICVSNWCYFQNIFFCWLSFCQNYYRWKHKIKERERVIWKFEFFSFTMFLFCRNRTIFFFFSWMTHSNPSVCVISSSYRMYYSHDDIFQLMCSNIKRYEWDFWQEKSNEYDAFTILRLCRYVSKYENMCKKIEYYVGLRILLK